MNLIFLVIHIPVVPIENWLQVTHNRRQKSLKVAVVLFFRHIVARMRLYPVEIPVYATRQLLNFSDGISVRLVVSKCKCGSFSVVAKLANRFVCVALGSQITKLLCAESA